MRSFTCGILLVVLLSLLRMSLAQQPPTSVVPGSAQYESAFRRPGGTTVPSEAFAAALPGHCQQVGGAPARDVGVSNRRSLPSNLGAFYPVSFAQRYIFGKADYSVGNLPASVTLGDFNGDGNLDVATVSVEDKTISILLGKPDGTLGSASVITFSSTVRALAAGDFNRDGRLDLAVVDGDSTLAILLGNGDGTFRPPVEYATGFSPVAITVRDLNGDGKLDLVTANSFSISVLLGNGDGTFGNHLDLDVQIIGCAPAPVAVGDLNGDGKPDLAITSENSVSVLLGNGDGTFQTAIQYGSGSLACSVGIGDFNGDHKPDLAVTRQDGTVSIFLGNGDGTFPNMTDYPTGPCPTVPVIADFNGDGILDLATPNQNCADYPNGFGSISVLLGKGDGSFQAHVDYGTGVDPTLAAGDFNGDGSLDLAIAAQNCIQFSPCGSGQLSILLGKGDGTFPGPVNYATPANPTSLATADFNRDGSLDLAVGNSNNQDNKTISILLGNGNGTFQPHVDYVAGGGSFSVAAVDLNRDGKPDVAVSNFNESTISILLGNGDGSLQGHVDYPTGASPVALVTGDFNNDGKVDLVTAPSLGSSISILPGNGDGTFKNHVEFPAGSSTLDVSAGDFNGDGKLDLAVSNFYFGTVSILLGNGNATFQAPVSFDAGQSPRTVTVADLNGDGRPDLVVTNYFNSPDGINIAVLLGNGDGTFQPPVGYSGGDIPLAVTVADVDGDGKLDLVVANSGIGIGLLLGNGDGTFRGHIDYAQGTGFGSILTGDFAGHGATDAVATNTNAGVVAVLLNSSVIALYPNQFTFAPEFTGTTSPAKTFLLSNPGSAPLTVLTIVAGGDFSQTNSCPISPATLAPGANCTISATFTPTQLGLRTGTITVTDNALAGRQVIALNGTGISRFAVYNPALGAPECAFPGRSCDSGPSLLLGKDNMAGGAEPNQPNTIHNSCADGTAGIFHVDESIDRLTVATSNGLSMAQGSIVRVNATVWVADPTQDALDLYYAADANNPTWIYAATLVPRAPGSQTLSALFRLRPGHLQAFRANFRKGGARSSCSSGNYDDHDDLAFAVR